MHIKQSAILDVCHVIYGGPEPGGLGKHMKIMEGSKQVEREGCFNKQDLVQLVPGRDVRFVLKVIYI